MYLLVLDSQVTCQLRGGRGLYNGISQSANMLAGGGLRLVVVVVVVVSCFLFLASSRASDVLDVGCEWIIHDKRINTLFGESGDQLADGPMRNQLQRRPEGLRNERQRARSLLIF